MTRTPSLAQAWGLIRADVAHRRAHEGRPAGLRATLALLWQPGMRAAIAFRVQCWCYAHGFAPLGGLLKFVNLAAYGIELDERAAIGGGFVIGHAGSIAVGPGVTIGERCCLLHQNTIGMSPFREPGVAAGPVTIGDDVTFAVGAVAYGRITIGDGCRVGPNAVVDRSFPPGAALGGVPARARA